MFEPNKIKYHAKPLQQNKMSNVNSFAALDEDFKPLAASSDKAPKAEPKPAVAKYIPPSQRKEQQKKDAEEGKIDMNSNELFPTLGGTRIASAQKTATGDKSFKQKIDDLIAFEQLSEQERQDREEEARKMEGYVVLKVPKTAEARAQLCERFHTMLEQQTEDPDVLYHTMMNPPRWTPNAAPLTKSALHKVVEQYDDEFSDNESEYERDDIHRVHRDWTVDCS